MLSKPQIKMICVRYGSSVLKDMMWATLHVEKVIYQTDMHLVWILCLVKAQGGRHYGHVEQATNQKDMH